MARKKEPEIFTKECPNFDLEAFTGTDIKTLIRIINRPKEYTRHIRIKKKSGKIRRLIAPNDEYMAVIRNLLLNFFKFYRPHKNAHGFVLGRSVVTNARAHQGCYTQIHLDIKDFFDNITGRMANKALAGNRALCSQCNQRFKFAAGNCNPHISDQKCEEIVNINFEPANDGKIRAGTKRPILFWIISLCTFFDGRRKIRYTPQGFPTSPAISNFVMGIYFDKLATDYCKENKLKYTRYADDITISSKDYIDKKKVSEVITYMYKLIASFRKDKHDKTKISPNTKKTAVHRGKARRKVCGVVVNANRSIQRSKVMKFRAQLHNILVGKGKDPEKKEKHVPSAGEVRSIVGFANYLCMVNKKYKPYLKQANKIKEFHAK